MLQLTRDAAGSPSSPDDASPSDQTSKEVGTLLQEQQQNQVMFIFYNKDQQGDWNIARAALLVKKIDTLIVKKTSKGIFNVNEKLNRIRNFLSIL